MGTLLVRAAASAVACTLMLAAGCGNNAASPKTQVDDGKGPLSLVGGGGTQSIYAPKHVDSTWYASFGGFLPCRNNANEKIVLRDVHAATSIGSPSSVDAWWRHVPAAPKREGGKSVAWYPLGSTKGYPGHWREIQFRGDFTHGVANRPVTHVCDDKYVNADAFDSVVVVLSVPKSGLIVTSFTVDYTDNGQAKSLKVPWKLVACGTKVTNADWCG